MNGRFRFWGGLTLEVSGGGTGLVDVLNKTAENSGVEIAYQAPAVELNVECGRVVGVRARVDGAYTNISAGAVVLACGGFESNAEWRTRYLGPGWDIAKVRGTRFNTSEGIRMALDAGAMPWGQWSGAHAVGWELNAPTFGDLSVGDSFQKHSYPFGIMVNSRGERLVDEGAGFRNYTYAKYGQEILNQPGQFAWQVFDQKTTHLLRDEYHIRQITKMSTNSIEDLGRRMDGVDAAVFAKTVDEFNAAVGDTIDFDPNRNDGRGTSGLALNKSNWANTIGDPPFVAFAVTCGITFTFGGLRITPEAQVVDIDEKPMAGLFACGEVVGGIYYFNYPGGSGPTIGSVFGRIAGRNTATTSLAT